MGDWHVDDVGREADVHVWIERAGRANRVCLIGRRRARASILAGPVGWRAELDGDLGAGVLRGP